MKKHIDVIISGKVIKVGFRFGAMEQAYKDGVTGFVKYQKNKEIYMEVEGEDEALDKFVKWCSKGCPGSQVADIVISESPHLKNYKTFEIL